jgi:hypothetical protein
VPAYVGVLLQWFTLPSIPDTGIKITAIAISKIRIFPVAVFIVLPLLMNLYI